VVVTVGDVHQRGVTEDRVLLRLFLACLLAVVVLAAAPVVGPAAIAAVGPAAIAAVRVAVVGDPVAVPIGVDDLAAQVVRDPE
jgi:hypothetical protein